MNMIQYHFILSYRVSQAESLCKSLDNCDKVPLPNLTIFQGPDACTGWDKLPEQGQVAGDVWGWHAYG